MTGTKSHRRKLRIPEDVVRLSDKVIILSGDHGRRIFVACFYRLGGAGGEAPCAPQTLGLNVCERKSVMASEGLYQHGGRLFG